MHSTFFAGSDSTSGTRWVSATAKYTSEADSIFDACRFSQELSKPAKSRSKAVTSSTGFTNWTHNEKSSILQKSTATFGFDVVKSTNVLPSVTNPSTTCGGNIFKSDLFVFAASSPAIFSDKKCSRIHDFIRYAMSAVSNSKIPK